MSKKNDESKAEKAGAARGKYVGEMVTIQIAPDEVRPAVITRVNDDGTVNVHVFTDAADHQPDSPTYAKTLANVNLTATDEPAPTE